MARTGHTTAVPISLTPRRAKVALAGGLGLLASLCCCGGIVIANLDDPPPRPLPALNVPATTPSSPKPAESQVLASSPSSTPSPSSTSPAALAVPSKPAASPKPPAVSKPSPTPKRTTARPKPPPPPPDEPEPPVFYANCAAARAAGAAPISRGEPGYRRALDRNNDGVACE